MRAPDYPVLDLDDYRRQAQQGHAPDGVVRLAFSSEVEALSHSERTVRFRVSTRAVDRMKDTIDPKGWDLKNYKKNPVVLWAHGASSLPIGKSVKIEADDKGLVSVAQFATKEQYPFADTVYQMVLGGFLKATSVGFKPLKHVYNEARGGVDFLEQELLEYSVVPIPANPEALVEGRALDLGPMKAWLELQDPLWRPREPYIVLDDTDDDVYYVLDDPDAEQRGVPANVSTSLAPESTPWSAPTLSDFTDKPWNKLPASEKRHIAGHYAWCKTGTMPETFGDLALPHHEASSGKVVWNGVRAAMARANQVSGGNTDAIMAHLKAHARQFGKAASEYEFVDVEAEDVIAALGQVVGETIKEVERKLRGRVD